MSRGQAQEQWDLPRHFKNLETDSVCVFPMCRDDFERRRIVGQGFERKLVADEVLTKVV